MLFILSLKTFHDLPYIFLIKSRNWLLVSILSFRKLTFKFLTNAFTIDKLLLNSNI